MCNLEPIEHTELTKYAIKLLQKHNIKTAADLLAEEHSNLVKILNITEFAVIEIKKALRAQNPIKKYRLKELYKVVVTSKISKCKTGIASLDELLEAYNVYFESGAIWEICGLTGVGKTQLCKTIALNFVTKHSDNNEVLFIDTKADFSGTRIRQMLRSRLVEVKDCGHVMNLIKVERCFNMPSVLRVLEQFLLQKQINAAAVKAIKLIIIDSLPAVCLIYKNNEQRLLVRHYYARLWMLLNRLADNFGIAFLLVNVSMTVERKNNLESKCTEAEELNDDTENVDDDVFSTEPHCKHKPALGHYWSTIPNLRLSIELPMDTTNNTQLRYIKVIKSNYCQTGVAAQVQLTDTGFV